MYHSTLINELKIRIIPRIRSINQQIIKQKKTAPTAFTLGKLDRCLLVYQEIISDSRQPRAKKRIRPSHHCLFVQALCSFVSQLHFIRRGTYCSHRSTPLAFVELLLLDHVTPRARTSHCSNMRFVQKNFLADLILEVSEKNVLFILLRSKLSLHPVRLGL